MSDTDTDDKPLVPIQRDERGRLLPGSRLALGRPNAVASRVTELKHAMLSAVTADTMTELTGRLIDLCKSDDGKTALAALELLFNRVLGKPREHVELDVSATSTAATVNVASALDATDLAALEVMRRKLAAASDPAATIVDAEAINPV